MITDPDDPDYRYPQPGERLWHEPSQRWVTVTVLERGRHPHVDEVSVIDDGELRMVKLRSLREEQTPRPPTSRRPRARAGSSPGSERKSPGHSVTIP